MSKEYKEIVEKEPSIRLEEDIIFSFSGPLGEIKVFTEELEKLAEKHICVRALLTKTTRTVSEKGKKTSEFKHSIPSLKERWAIIKREERNALNANDKKA